MMKARTRFGLAWLLCIALMAASCATAPIETLYIHESDAINLYFKSNVDLHTYDGMPHTLHVCVYQLKAPNTFDQLADYKEGLYKLLACELFDPNVTRSTPYSIQPSKNLVYPMDRYDDTRYIGIVAGYKSFEKERMVYTLKMPLEVKKVRLGWFKHKKIMQPKAIDIEIQLGAQQIERVLITK